MSRERVFPFYSFISSHSSSSPSLLCTAIGVYDAHLSYVDEPLTRLGRTFNNLAIGCLTDVTCSQLGAPTLSTGYALTSVGIDDRPYTLFQLFGCQYHQYDTCVRVFAP